MRTSSLLCPQLSVRVGVDKEGESEVFVNKAFSTHRLLWHLQLLH